MVLLEVHEEKHVTRFAKGVSNFSTLTRHNSACSPAIASKFCGMNFTTLDNIVTKFNLITLL